MTEQQDPKTLISVTAEEIPPEEFDSPGEISAEQAKKAIESLNIKGRKTKGMEDVKEDPSSEIPSWVKIPPGFKPPQGVQCIFMRFKAEWTANPNKGERQCIAWPISVLEEKNALQRSRGDMLRSIDELSKQMVHYIDGVSVDWTGANPSGNIDQWWAEVGPKCRNVLHRIYTQTHNLSDDEHEDFFDNCIVVRTVG